MLQLTYPVSAHHQGALQSVITNSSTCWTVLVELYLLNCLLKLECIIAPCNSSRSTTTIDQHVYRYHRYISWVIWAFATNHEPFGMSTVTRRIRCQYYNKIRPDVNLVIPFLNFKSKIIFHSYKWCYNVDTMWRHCQVSVFHQWNMMPFFYDVEWKMGNVWGSSSFDQIVPPFWSTRFGPFWHFSSFMPFQPL